jgi:hypothetical protein
VRERERKRGSSFFNEMGMHREKRSREKKQVREEK